MIRKKTPKWCPKKHCIEESINDAGMTIPKHQLETARMTLRLPIEIHDEVQAAAERNGHSMTAEIIARLKSASISERMEALTREVAEMKSVMRAFRDK